MTTPTPAQDAQPAAYFINDAQEGEPAHYVQVCSTYIADPDVVPLYASPPTAAGVVQALEEARDAFRALLMPEDPRHSRIAAALASLPQPAVVEVSLPELPTPDTRSLALSGREVDYIDGFEAGYESAADQLHARDASILAAVSKAMGVEVKGKHADQA